jgi:hypothetical protein
VVLGLSGYLSVKALSAYVFLGRTTTSCPLLGARLVILNPGHVSAYIQNVRLKNDDQEKPHSAKAVFPSSQRPEIDELSEQQIAAMGELLLADRKFEAVRQYQEATEVNLSRAQSVIDELESDLFQRHPEKIPPDPRWVVFQGCLALLSVIIVPLVFLAFVFGLIAGEPHSLAGLIGFSMSAGATALYRKNHSQLTRHQLIFALLFFAGIASMAMFHSIFPIVIGSLIGVAVGILVVCFFPLLRPLFRLDDSKDSVLEQRAESVNWKMRYFNWIFGESISTRQDKSDERFDDN